MNRTPAQFLLKMGTILAQWPLNFWDVRPAGTSWGQVSVRQKTEYSGSNRCQKAHQRRRPALV